MNQSGLKSSNSASLKDDGLQAALRALKEAAEAIADCANSEPIGLSADESNDLALIAAQLATVASKAAAGNVSSPTAIVGLLDAAMLAMSQNVDSLALLKDTVLKDSIAGVKDAGSLIDTQRRVLKRKEKIAASDSTTAPNQKNATVLAKKAPDRADAKKPSEPQAQAPTSESPDKQNSVSDQVKRSREVADQAVAGKESATTSHEIGWKLKAVLTAAIVLLAVIAAELLTPIIARQWANELNAPIDRLLQQNGTLVPHDGIGSEMYFDVEGGKITGCRPRIKLEADR